MRRMNTALTLSAALGALTLAVVPRAEAAGGLPEVPGYRLTLVAEGLAFPWSLAFLPDGRLLVSERDGGLRLIEGGHLLEAPIAGVPAAYVKSQGGLFDIVLHPRFAETGWLYLTFAKGDAKGNATAVIRARLAGSALTEVTPIFEAAPKKTTAVHYGGRMVFLPDETFLLTVGDGFVHREQAQDLSSHFGKVLRLKDDGTVPTDNPFIGTAGARPEIWTYGHRNMQGIARDPVTGTVYEHEHGPRGGDEVNILLPGRNYGWPVITYGIDYTGARISPLTAREGMEQPLVDWTPSLAPAGLAVYRGPLFPDWDGDLLVATLVDQDLRRVDLEDGKVVGQERLFGALGVRLRDVRVGPDGALYLLTDEAEGRIVKIDPGP